MSKRYLTGSRKRLQKLGQLNKHAGSGATKRKIRGAHKMLSYEAEAKRRGVPVCRVIAEALTNE